MEDWQWIINVLIMMAFSVTGWFARQVWESVNRLKEDLNKLEVDLPNTYVKQSDFIIHTDRANLANNEQLSEIKTLMYRMLDKLDLKADK